MVSGRQWRIGDHEVHRHSRTGRGVLHHFGDHLHGVRSDQRNRVHVQRRGDQCRRRWAAQHHGGRDSDQSGPDREGQDPQEDQAQGQDRTAEEGGEDQRRAEGQGKVKVSPKSKKYSKVKITKSGKVTIQTKGKRKLKVTLKLKAPATDRYTAYSYTKKWKVKK